MSRWRRMVVPGVAVHVIQRGNHRQPIFFATGDYEAMCQETLRADTLARFRKSTEAGEVIGDNRFCAESSATDTTVTAEALSLESARTTKISDRLFPLNLDSSLHRHELSGIRTFRSATSFLFQCHSLRGETLSHHCVRTRPDCLPHCLGRYAGRLGFG